MGERREQLDHFVFGELEALELGALGGAVGVVLLAPEGGGAC